MTKHTKLAIFTICSNNYVPSAHVLLRSARLFQPDADLFLCLADRTIVAPGLYDPDWTIIEACSLPIQDFAGFAFRYDIMEFNTALKPFMFQHLLEQCDYDVVLYFDPDIELFRPLASLVERLRGGASLVLTPHMCAPCLADTEPNDLTIMRAGIYNLGFLGASRGREASEVIAWWARRLRYECLNAQSEGIFVDQKFMDLAPAFAASAHVCRDTSMNVAYWNLQQRDLAGGEGAWTVDGEPLTFFHYSGFDPRQPDRLSKYDTRLDGSMPEPLRRLTAAYADKLLARDHGSVSAATYAYGQFASGTAIHPLVRRMFRQSHQIWPQDPFETYEAFLHEPAPGTSRQDPARVVTNFMKFLHGHFPHLRTRLDLADRDHVRELVDWYVIHSAADLRLDQPMIEPEAARLGARQMTPARRVSGRGAKPCAEATLATLDGQVRLDGVNEADPCRLNVFDISPTPGLHTRPLRISIPVWNYARFPEAWLPLFHEVDEVWAPSRFIQMSLAGRLERPVITMPLTIERAAPPEQPRRRLGLPENRFLFLCTFDGAAGFERQNPLGAIAAFRQAFPHHDTAGLVLYDASGAPPADQRRRLHEQMSGRPDIILLDRSERLGLTAAVDGVLSLHRGDGLGLMPAEALLLGKPVIATGYGASREFVTPLTGYPVGYALVPADEDATGSPLPGQLWAEPDVAHAAWLMRRLHADPAQADARVASGRALVQHEHGRATVADCRRRRLQSLRVA